MKKIIIACLLSLPLISVAQLKKKKSEEKKSTGKFYFAIEGKMEGYKYDKIMFAPFLNQSKVDTVKVVNGKFNYSGNFDEAAAYVYLREDGQNNVFYLDPGPHEMIIDVIENKGFGITNSPSQESYNQFLTYANPYLERRANYAKLPPDSAQIIQQQNEFAIQELFKGYIKDTNAAPLSVSFMVYNSLAQMTNSGEAAMLELYNGMHEKAKQTELSKKSLAMINRMSADDMGKIAPDFTLLDSSGKKVTLSQYRGKNYVLVDFWATWCGPCRAEFPALIEAQKKYKDKGLVILGVSIDADYKKWKDMLAKPGFTTWTHVWDGPQGPNQVVNTLYNVPSIPRNFLLDKNGKVIARNLRGAGVEQQLEQLIK